MASEYRITQEQTNYEITLARVGPQGARGSGGGVTNVTIPVWNSSTAYVEGAPVVYTVNDTELLYRANRDNTNRQPNTSPDDWTLLSASGGGGGSSLVWEFVDSEFAYAAPLAADTAVIPTRIQLDSDSGLVLIPNGTGVYRIGQRPTNTPFTFTASALNPAVPGIVTTESLTGNNYVSTLTAATGTTFSRVTSVTMTINGAAQTIAWDSDNADSTSLTLRGASLNSVGNYVVTVNARGLNTAGDSEDASATISFSRLNVPYSVTLSTNWTNTDTGQASPAFYVDVTAAANTTFTRITGAELLSTDTYGGLYPLTLTTPSEGVNRVQVSASTLIPPGTYTVRISSTGMSSSGEIENSVDDISRTRISTYFYGALDTDVTPTQNQAGLNLLTDANDTLSPDDTITVTTADIGKNLWLAVPQVTSTDPQLSFNNIPITPLVEGDYFTVNAVSWRLYFYDQITAAGTFGVHSL